MQTHPFSPANLSIFEILKTCENINIHLHLFQKYIKYLCFQEGQGLPPTPRPIQPAAFNVGWMRDRLKAVRTYTPTPFYKSSLSDMVHILCY